MKSFKKNISGILIYLFTGLFFLFQYIKLDNVMNFNNKEMANFLMLLITYFLIVGLFLSLISKYKCDIFEPFIFCSIIMIMLFIITPIINILINDLLIFGEDVMGATIKGTVIFILSYFMYCLGYFRFKNKKNLISLDIKLSNTEFLRKKKRITIISTIMWFICFLLTVIYIYSSGMSLSYFFSMGLNGEYSNKVTGSSLEFLSQFGYSMVTIWMLIFVFSNSKLLKIFLGIITLLIYIMEGFRFIIIIMMVAPLLYMYIQRGKRPSVKTLSMLSALLFFIIGIVGFLRDDLRSGEGISWYDFGISSIIDAVKGNFDIYKSYYGTILAVPKLMEYTLGKQIMYTFVLFIPRALWPSKPYPLQGTIVSLGINPIAAASGFAFPNLGEYYAEFGIVGCMIILYLLGGLSSKLKKLYLSKGRSELSIIMYSILLPSTLQLIIRGYTPSNFYLIIFLIVPVLIVNFIVGGKIIDK